MERPTLMIRMRTSMKQKYLKSTPMIASTPISMRQRKMTKLETKKATRVEKVREEKEVT